MYCAGYVLHKIVFPKEQAILAKANTINTFSSPAKAGVYWNPGNWDDDNWDGAINKQDGIDKIERNEVNRIGGWPILKIRKKELALAKRSWDIK